MPENSLRIKQNTQINSNTSRVKRNHSKRGKERESGSEKTLNKTKEEAVSIVQLHCWCLLVFAPIAAKEIEKIEHIPILSSHRQRYRRSFIFFFLISFCLSSTNLFSFLPQSLFLCVSFTLWQFHCEKSTRQWKKKTIWSVFSKKMVEANNERILSPKRRR